MGMNGHFCTCPSTDCPLHPFNHEKGCDLCIQKNLAKGEIPSCFYLKVSPDADGLSEYTIESFVDFFLKNKEQYLKTKGSCGPKGETDGNTVCQSE